MSSKLLPEAIRGSWYFFPEEGAPEDILQEGGQLITFGLDGNFARYDLSQGHKTEAESGDYTFDGDFLILRARNTDTYRVHVERDWYWFLEGKKTSRRLFRGLIGDDDDIVLSDEQRRKIAAAPMRASVETGFSEDDDAIFDLCFKDADNNTHRIGCFCAQHDEDGSAWVGLTALAQGLQQSTWEAIIQKSYLGRHLDAHSDVDDLHVELLGTA